MNTKLFHPINHTLEGTDLFRSVLAFPYATETVAQLMAKTWSPTPWMVNAYTGPCESNRDRAMLDWCHQRGPECSPIRGHDGSRQRGGATVHGWTWFGFCNEKLMHDFLAAFPTPEEVEPGRIVESYLEA